MWFCITQNKNYCQFWGRFFIIFKRFFEVLTTFFIVVFSSIPILCIFFWPENINILPTCFCYLDVRFTAMSYFSAVSQGQKREVNPDWPRRSVRSIRHWLWLSLSPSLPLQTGLSPKHTGLRGSLLDWNNDDQYLSLLSRLAKALLPCPPTHTGREG